MIKWLEMREESVLSLLVRSTNSVVRFTNNKKKTRGKDQRHHRDQHLQL